MVWEKNDLCILYTAIWSTKQTQIQVLVLCYISCYSYPWIQEYFVCFFVFFWIHTFFFFRLTQTRVSKQHETKPKQCSFQHESNPSFRATALFIFPSKARAGTKAASERGTETRCRSYNERLDTQPERDNLSELQHWHMFPCQHMKPDYKRVNRISNIFFLKALWWETYWKLDVPEHRVMPGIRK